MTVAAFIFLCFFNIKDVRSKSLLKRIEYYAESFANKRKYDKKTQIELFLTESAPLKIMGVSIKTTTGIFTFRVILSITALIICIVLGFFAEKNFFMISFILASVLYFLPFEILKSRIKAISGKILNELPESLDILSSLIKTGLSLDQAIEYYSINYKGEISGLFKIAKTKIYEGKSPGDAYFEIAELSFCNEFRTIIKIIVQSDIVGNPIYKVLKELSRNIRQDQRDRIKIKAERLESSLMLVIFIFMFIPMMVLFLLPVIPQLKMIFN